MITETDREIIETISAKYGAKRVILFGSSLSADQESSDIDIAVEGIDGREFFTFYGELLFALSKPVDVVDLSTRSRFTELIKREAVRRDDIARAIDNLRRGLPSVVKVELRDDPLVLAKEMAFRLRVEVDARNAIGERIKEGM
jgi:predicted nucleotidyltransferase